MIACIPFVSCNVRLFSGKQTGGTLRLFKAGNGQLQRLIAGFDAQRVVQRHPVAVIVSANRFKNLSSMDSIAQHRLIAV